MKRLLLSLVAVAALCVPATAQNKVKNLYTSSSALDCSQLLNTAQTVQLNRYLMAGYNTICLPMSVDAAVWQNASHGARLESFVGIAQDGNVLNLYFLDCTAEGVEAGVPYLVYSPVAQNIRLKNTEAAGIGDGLRQVRLSDEQGNTITFGSSWERQSRDGMYGIPAKQETTPLESILIRTDGEKVFLPTRCGFNWDAQSATATELHICHIKSIDEATGISAISETSANGATYDLNGRRVTTPTKGIVIRNGKKVANK